MSRDSPAAVLFDSNGNPLAVLEDVVIPASTPSILLCGKDADGKAQIPEVLTAAGVKYLSVMGRVTVINPTPPPGTTSVTIAADNPLSISTTYDHEYVIPNGAIFHLQQIVAGAEGDPTEKGSKIDVYYDDGTTEHLIDRLYVSGFTTTVSYADIDKSRNNTSLEGNGTTKKIIVRRIRLSGVAQEVDAVVRGYVHT